MLQTCYLTVEELKSYTPISTNVDTSKLENWIPVAETMHIIGILGTALDTALKSEIETLGTLTGNNATLLVYIQNASAWYTFYEASTFLRTEARNRGVVQNYADNSSVAPFEDFKAYRQDILDKAMFYRNRLIDYLNCNSTLFPLYRSECNTGCDCTDTYIGMQKDNSSGIYLG